jgi:hypothetical protein
MLRAKAFVWSGEMGKVPLKETHIENTINRWLGQNPGAEVVDIRLTTAAASDTCIGTGGASLFCLILYRTPASADS